MWWPIAGLDNSHGNGITRLPITYTLTNLEHHCIECRYALGGRSMGIRETIKYYRGVSEQID